MELILYTNAISDTCLPLASVLVEIYLKIGKATGDRSKIIWRGQSQNLRIDGLETFDVTVVLDLLG